MARSILVARTCKTNSPRLFALPAGAAVRTAVLKEFNSDSHHSSFPSHIPHLFDKIPEPNLSSYNSYIKFLTNKSSFHDVLNVYSHMLKITILPNHLTFPGLLKSCGAIPALSFGKAVHCHMVILNLATDVFLFNGLISMYAKCHDIISACKVFEQMSLKNVVSWTSIISGYVQNGLPLEAVRLFAEMRLASDILLDFVVIVSVIKAYMDLKELMNGRCVHGLVIRGGFFEEQDLIITLTSMYAKFGQVHVARDLFDRLISSDVILWNAMISGYAKNGYSSEAIYLFKKMLARDFSPDSITIRLVISACAQSGALDVGKWVEDYASKTKFKKDIFVITALIDMYSKCGSIYNARALFDRLPQRDRDVVVWSAMITGYGFHGQADEAINLFDEMRKSGVVPNDVTYLGLLTACNHSGLVENGKKYFNFMRDNGIEPRHQHYACMVDLLARAGHLLDAYELIKTMPMDPEVSVWGALLTACSMYGNVELGEYAAKRVFSIDSSNAGHHIQLSNIYASAQLWENVAKIRVRMQERGLTKPIGCTFIEINGKLQSFIAGEKSYPKSVEVYEMLDKLEKKLKDSLLDFEEENEGSFCNHSEKLAVAFGLINTAPGTTLRITKGSGTCRRCHSETKYISKIVEREIIVRDVNSFHHFKGWHCSCGDCW